MARLLFFYCKQMVGAILAAPVLLMLARVSSLVSAKSVFASESLVGASPVLPTAGILVRR